jgi:hypothetical protein
MEEFGDRTLRILERRNILCNGTGLKHTPLEFHVMKSYFFSFFISYFVILKLRKITIFCPNFETAFTSERALGRAAVVLSANRVSKW